MLGLSQETVGNAIGVTFQQIQKYERGINRVGSSRLFQFSKILSAPVSYFFDDMDTPTQQGKDAQVAGVAEESAPFEHEKLYSRETLEMMRAYYRITEPKVRKRVFELIKSLADDKPVE